MPLGFQRSLQRVSMTDEIPPITHPLGEHWRQPDRSRILIDETHAVMDQATFDDLSEYSTSFPSGVYEGKMWKQNLTVYRTLRSPDVDPCAFPDWRLVWYGYADSPK